MYRLTAAWTTLLGITSAIRTCTYTANFDNLTHSQLYKAPPKGYSRLNWYGNVVVTPNPVSYPVYGLPKYPFKGSSSPYVISTPTGFNFGTSEPDSPDNGYSFTIESFDIACASIVPQQETPVPCSFALTLSAGNFENRTTYEYDYDGSDAKHPKFMTVKGPHVSKPYVENYVSNYEINLIGTPLGKYPLGNGVTLFIDNIVTRQPCNPPGA